MVIIREAALGVSGKCIITIVKEKLFEKIISMSFIRLVLTQGAICPLECIRRN